MSRAATYSQDRTQVLTKQTAIIIGASLAIAICARLSFPLPFTPVPLTLANFAVVAVGLILGSKRGFAAAALYLAQGAAGMPVFSPAGPGGIAQLLGPTGGYLIAYPLVAFVAGYIAERGVKTFGRKLVAAVAAEIVLFAVGVTWLMALTRTPFVVAASFGLYPFVFGEIMKMMGAAGVAAKFTARAK